MARPRQGAGGVDLDKTIELSRSTIASLGDLRHRNERARPTLLAIAGPALGKMFEVGEEMVIGRSHEASIVIIDDGISRRHCKLIRRREGHVLLDMDSTNGVFVNGKRVREQVLQPGDRIRVGSTTILKFSLQDALEESFQKRMYDSAVRDALTGTYNKRYFQDSISNEFAYFARHNLQMSVVMLDIDHFKKINDTYGHPAGDYVLKIVAKLIAQGLRTEDILCRYGGEEFAIILRSTDVQQAVLVAERIRKSIAASTFVFEGAKIPITISLGVATLVNGNFSSPEHLVKAADKFLYLAKESGRNRTACAPAGRPQRRPTR